MEEKRDHTIVRALLPIVPYESKNAKRMTVLYFQLTGISKKAKLENCIVGIIAAFVLQTSRGLKLRFDERQYNHFLFELLPMCYPASTPGSILVIISTKYWFPYAVAKPGNNWFP